MLEFRAYVPAAQADACVAALDAIPGVTHLTRLPAATDGTVPLLAEVDAHHVEAAFGSLEANGVPPEAIGVTRAEWIRPVSAVPVEAGDLLWIDLIGSARVVSNVGTRYLLLMAVAGVIAGYGVIINNAVLIVGAMAVSPDLLPLIAASVGIVGRRWRLVGRASMALIVGFGTAALAAGVITLFLTVVGLIGEVDLVTGLVASMSRVGVGTLGVALAAGVAGTVAFETRASAAVGVAISVTTIPAAASAGVAAGVGDWPRVLSALSVLAVNIVAIVFAGSVTLIVQRWFDARADAKGQKAG